MNYTHPSITIEQPVPGRYQITGFQAGTVFIPEVGYLAPPQIVDLAMTPDLAAALRAVLDDFEPSAEPVGFESAPRRRRKTKAEPEADAEPDAEPEPEGGAEPDAEPEPEGGAE